MKIVNRPQFMELPPGTLYRKFITEFAFEELEVKFESLPSEKNPEYGDFVCMPLSDIDWNGPNGMFDRLEDMMEKGASYPLDLDCAGRDGCFEREAMFLVYEKDDVVALRNFLNGLLEDLG